MSRLIYNAWFLVWVQWETGIQLRIIYVLCLVIMTSAVLTILKILVRF